MISMETIKTAVLLTVAAILFILILMIAIAIFQLLKELKNYFEAKKNFECVQIEERINPAFPDKKLTYIEKLNISVSVINFINVLIDSEIARMIDTLRRLRAPYEAKNLDNDSERIANAVFKAFNIEETFQKEKMILDAEYILKYITDETIIRLMNETYKYNTGNINE